MLLIIDKSQAEANTVSDIFNYMGIVSYGATPEGAAAEFSNRHKAIIFIHPELMSSTEELIRLARTYSLDASVFAISEAADYALGGSSNLYSLFDAVFPDGLLSSQLIFDILSYISESGKEAVGTYRIAGIEASIHNPVPTYFDTPVNLTKTETMILRFLITSYPIAKSSRDVLKYAFRSGRMPESSSIRTHISSINKKLALITGRHIITYKTGEGYTLDTP